MTQLTLQEITNWIEIPNSAMFRIHVYLGECKKVKKREIASQILREEVYIEHEKYQDIDFMMDLDAKWHSTLVQS